MSGLAGAIITNKRTGVVTGGKWIKRAQVIGAQVKQFSAGEAR